MKNPWMSMRLSGANAWSGAARVMMAAEMKKNQNAMMKEAARQATEFGFPHMKSDTTPPAKRKRLTTRR